MPTAIVGQLIGKGGATVRTLQRLSGAKIHLVADAATEEREAETGRKQTATSEVKLSGTEAQLTRAKELIMECLTVISKRRGGLTDASGQRVRMETVDEYLARSIS